MSKSKFFVVAREGATADGRTIDREWITQMAQNYDPSIYGARINLEHIKGIFPDGDFKRLGDVLALKAEERDGKFCLLAQISPTPELVEMTKKRQKVYTSIEVNPNFADLNSAYLVGLAVTDDPASLGTEMLNFAATAKENPFAKRKADEGNFITEGIEFSLDMEGETVENIFARVKAIFSKKASSDDERFANQEKAIELLSEKYLESATQVEVLSKKVEEVENKFASQSKEFSTIQRTIEKLANTEDNPNPTPFALGGEGQTDTYF